MRLGEKERVGVSRICVVGGSGYVGLGYAAVLADLGHEVVALDLDAAKVGRLNRGECPIYEPGLPELLARLRPTGRLRFTTEYAEAVPGAAFVFLCVGTPSLSDGAADLRQVRAAAAAVGRHLIPGGDTIVVNKSTLPVGAGDLVACLVAEHAPPGAGARVVANPEFLREGAALHDIYHPSRVVVGADPADAQAAAAVAALYAPFAAPTLVTDRRSAEMIKYAANAFLVAKISFINEVAQVCERLGADVTVVAQGIGLDPRIGPLFLEAGLGFGGSCFPKDVGALAHMAEGAGIEPRLLRAVLAINGEVRRRFVARAEALLGGLDGKVVAVWGLAFKEGTDDLRAAPALEIVPMLAERGALVRAHDPVAMARARDLLPGVSFADTPLAAATGADAVLVVTPWPQYRDADLGALARAMRGDLLLDGRNLFDAAAAAEVGLRHAGVGRPTVVPRPAVGTGEAGAETADADGRG